MTAKKKRNQKSVGRSAAKPKFNPGRAGCEARLYLVRGYHSTTPITDENGKRNPQDCLRICANGIYEVLEHVRKWETGFDIWSIRLLGLTVLLSGSMYDG
jgi:hypothetical protein